MKMLLGLVFILSAANAYADTQKDDKAIYDALNVQELALPSVYPISAFQKIVGRLICSHDVNVELKTENYSCSLMQSTND